MNNIHKKNLQLSEMGEPDICDTFEYGEDRITKMQDKLINKRMKMVQEERISKQKYTNDLKVVDLLKFLTRVEKERIYLSKEDFEAIEFGL